MASINDRLDDDTWVENLKKSDPKAFDSASYLIVGSTLKAEIECCIDPHCKVGVKTGKGERARRKNSAGAFHEGPLSYYWVFCYACNRIAHLTCQGYTNADFTVLKLTKPWCCPACLTDPYNRAAVDFFEKKDLINLTVASRKTLFVNPNPIAPPSTTINLDDTSVGDEDNHQIYKDKYLNQRREFEELTAKFLQVTEECAAKDERLLQLEVKLSKFDDLETRLKKMEESRLEIPPIENSDRRSLGAFRRSQVHSSSFIAEPVLTVKDVLSRTYLSKSNLKNNSESRHVRIEEAAPLHPRRQSLIDDLNVNDLTRTERITLEHTQAQLETSEAQREISQTMKLGVIRKAVPDISTFEGEPLKWIQFKRDVQRHIDVGKYDEDIVRLKLLKALKGTARARVQDIIDTTDLSTVMRMLEESFGEPTRIIEHSSREILNIKVGRELYKDDVIVISTKIQAYFAACQYAGVSYANSNHLASHIFSQLSLVHKQLFRNKFRLDNPTQPARLIDLESLFSFLEDLAKDLEDRKVEEKKLEDKKQRPAQLQSISAVNTRSSPKNMNENPFSVNEKNGYDMSIVNALAKWCDICASATHFSVQCNKYKAMTDANRLNCVNEKSLCRNCLLSRDHRAFECNVKGVCNSSMNGSQCGKLHHSSLHKALGTISKNVYKGKNSQAVGGKSKGYRRVNTNYNQQRAANIYNQPSTAPANPPQAEKQQNPSDSTVDKIIQSAPVVTQANARQATVAQSTTGKGNTTEMLHSRLNYVAYPITRQQCSLRQEKVPATVKVFKTVFYGVNGYVTDYSMGDSGAEVTLLRDDLRELLGLTGTKCKLPLQWTDGKVKQVDALRVNIEVQGVHDGAERIVLRNCYSVTTDTLTLASRSLDMNKMKQQFPYLRDVPFESYYNVSPPLLIGGPHASAIESIDKLYENGEGNPVGLKSKLGWTVYGGCPEESSDPFFVENINTDESLIESSYERISNEELLDRYAYFCSIESLGIANNHEHNTADEQNALDIVREEMRTLPDGSIELPLVWNRLDGEIPRIPDNLKMVLKRQAAHDKSLQKKPAYLAAYNDNFRELLAEGYARAATEEDLYGEWPNVNYIPMSLVVNANKNPPKFRIVFDASAKYLDTSLNKNLLKGPDLLVDLINPLISMRKNKVAYTADIKSMFMRMKICLRDQQCQRVLWRESELDEYKIFIVSSMMFGPTPSPFSSQYVKNDTADKWKHTYPEAAEIIKRDMYMDDLLTSAKSAKEAANLAQQCIEIFASINWHLVAFQSNSLEFLKSLPEKNVKQNTIPLLESESDSCVTKVLGCEWDSKNDSFVFKFDKNLFIKIVTEKQHRPTKRDQCSTLARIFDVLGLISHFTIRGKILLQRSWVAGLNWDEQISDSDCKLWNIWLADVENIAKVKIPRQFNPFANLEMCDSVELHTFVDAGTEAFAAVCYIVSVNKNERMSNIVMAKAKVTPIRHKSRTNISEMPRLELCASLIGCRLAHKVTKQLQGINLKRFFWCDSTAVLHWIRNPNHKLLKYAISPVEEILDKTLRNEWEKVPTKINAADIATKFQKFDFSDSDSVWYKGPAFLRLKSEHWPRETESGEPPLDPESIQVSSVSVGSVVYVPKHKLPPIDCPIMSDYLIDSFSHSITCSWKKLVRATARGLKIWLDGVIPLIKSKKWNDSSVRKEIKNFHENFERLTPSDIERAELFLIRKAQREEYSQEYERMSKNLPIDNQMFKELQAFLDTEGVIRIHSRVELPECVYPQKFAPLVPRKNALTRLLLLNVHYEYRHICIESQIAAIRAKYWIPQIRTALKSVQYHCNFCSLKRAKPYAPLMAPLPHCRINYEERPFDTVGLDCLGPIMTVNYTKQKKVWVLIFVCTLTRFICLHVLDSLESVKVLEAITQFMNSHGPVRRFISDRGTNFVGAANIIEEDRQKTMKFLNEQHKLVNPRLLEKYDIEWTLLPAHSPWMGGFYERLIKEVKRSIAHVLDRPRLDRTTLNIALQDAAYRINNRPLTHNSISPHDDQVLTPHLLAKNKSGWPYLPGVMNKNPPNILLDRSVYRRGRALADEIMRRFYSNYLPILTKRTKWYKDEKPLRVGDLVMLIEPNDTRSEWKRAKVVRLYKGRDGKCRVADVEMPDGTLKKYRSVQRLAKLEIMTLENIQ